ncbi:MAG: single-stranded DNA-binding protein [Bifidobacteriaceae bacterium]|jgi:single-strand DNA-binding protein|nr:single-stranded DNA-binding protein [Bifidobacteriaceae bacterium]
MAGDTVITVVGNLTADPELRFTANGATPVANFTVASTPRTYDRGTGEWKDGEALFLRCSVWREAAENVAESLTKGMRVIVQGRLTQRSYETREGERRTVVELQVDEVGPSLRYASAKVQRNPRSGGYDAAGSPGAGGGGYGGPPQGGYGPPGGGYGAPAGGYGAPSASGGYGAPPPPPQGGNYGGGSTEDRWAAPGVAGSIDDEPPF